MEPHLIICQLWSPTGKARRSLSTPVLGDVPASYSSSRMPWPYDRGEMEARSTRRLENIQELKGKNACTEQLKIVIYYNPLGTAILLYDT
jgi:hypothetical protein